MEKFNTVWFPLLYSCNNKCSWCYAPAAQTACKEKIFTDEKENDFLNLVSDLGVKRIIFIGGEPTLYKDLNRIIERTAKKGIKPSVVTNGRKLSDLNFTKSLKNSGLKSITVSIEGSSPDIHDDITNIKGSYYETVKGIENAIYAGLYTSTETTISKKNKDNLEETVTFLEEYNLSSRLFNICGPCVSDLKNSDSYTLHEGASLYEKVYKTAIKKNTKLVTPVPVCAFDNDIYKEMAKNNAISHGCHVLFGFNFVLDPNGDVLPCVHFSNFPIFNAYENGKVMSAERFRERYNDPKGENQQFRSALKRYPSEKCKNDGCWDPCTGGCSVFWLKYNPSEEIKGKNA
jgi:radical SAM protein with 4Fe4S-binding SPASM domain